jgi:hypothetical protein
MRKLILLLPLLLGFAAGQELLTNGDFEQDLTVGWTRVDTGYGTHDAARDTTYHPDPDYEAFVYQYDNPGVTQLVQYVDAPGTVMTFSFWAKFEEGGGSSSCWPAGCVSIYYCDAANTILGETRFFYSTYANWTPSPTLSLHQTTTADWTQYTLDVAEELSQNLGGVNPDDVARIGVAVVAYAGGG